MKLLKYLANSILYFLSKFNTCMHVQSDYWINLDSEKKEEIIKKIKSGIIKPIDLT